MRNSGTFLRKVSDTIERYSLIQEGKTILIGFSGGVDSVALTLALQRLYPPPKLHLVLLHVNHQLRGQEADEDEQFARRFAEHHSLTCIARRVNVPDAADKMGLSLEETARILRFDIFIKLAKQIDADSVALAHNKNDLAETVLLQLLRGSGKTGLLGFKPSVEFNDVNIIRPLYDVTREEIMTFIKEKDASYRIDSTNRDRRFLRNKIRLDLIPYLEKNYNPNIISTLHRSAEIMSAEDQYLDHLTSELYRRYRRTKKGTILILPIDSVLNLPLPLQRRFLRRWVMELLEASHPPYLTDIEAIRHLLDANQTGKYHLVNNRLVLYRDYAHLIPGRIPSRKLKKGRIPSEEINAEIRRSLLAGFPLLGYSFMTVKPEDTLALSLTQLRTVRKKRRFNIGRYTLLISNRKPSGDKPQRVTFCLNLEDVDQSIEFRTARKNDFIQINRGTKSIQRFFIDRKIPSPLRTSILLLCSGKRVLWIPGVWATRAGNKKRTSKGKRYLELRQS